MEYASNGDLHKYLQKNFTEIDWRKKLAILYNITNGLLDIHNANFIHRDLHSGNMLMSYYCKIGDLGLSRPANDTLLDNEIYGVIPYIAPEIFKGSLSSYISKCSSIFSKCSSINFSSNDYISNELVFDIDIKSSKLDSLGTKRNIEELNINSFENNGKRLKEK
ncbi:unnamed protein product [Rhizophagus irregularis]|nr:unnamed protein product [Rhizophagus irregularis]